MQYDTASLCNMDFYSVYGPEAFISLTCVSHKLWKTQIKHATWKTHPVREVTTARSASRQDGIYRSFVGKRLPLESQSVLSRWWCSSTDLRGRAGMERLLWLPTSGGIDPDLLGMCHIGETCMTASGGWHVRLHTQRFLASITKFKDVFLLRLKHGSVPL